jgi:hypothetical protein
MEEKIVLIKQADLATEARKEERIKEAVVIIKQADLVDQKIKIKNKLFRKFNNIYIF